MYMQNALKFFPLRTSELPIGESCKMYFPIENHHCYGCLPSNMFLRKNRRTSIPNLAFIVIILKVMLSNLIKIIDTFLYAVVNMRNPAVRTMVTA